MEDVMDLSERKFSAGMLDGGWSLLPVAATIGGAWAFAAPLENDHFTTLIAALALILGGWCPLWWSVTRTHWATPLSLWREWREKDDLPLWPYLQHGTPGDALHLTLEQACSWWRNVGHTTLALPLRRAGLSLLVSILLGLILGRTALLLTLLLVSWTELATLWHGGKGEVGTVGAAVALVGLPWLLGASLNESEIALAAISAFSLVMLVGLYAHPSPLAVGGPILAATFLIWQKHFIAAGWLLLLALPGLLVLQHHPTARHYRQAIAPWLLAMVLLIALVL